MTLELPQDNRNLSSHSMEESSIPDDFFLLMSLALDEMLSEEEANRFHAYLAQEPALVLEWQSWQSMDGRLHSEPVVEPPADFMAKFNLRLAEESSSADAFSVLMSLALDGLLSKEEEQRFHRAMEEDAALANEWQRWQSVADQFQNASSVLPPTDFVARVNQRLANQIQRRKVWLAAGVGTTVTLLWVIAIGVLYLLGSYMVTSQGAWLGDQIHNLTYLSSTVGEWLTTLGLAISRSVNVTLSYPQMWGMAVGYMAISALILSMWTRMLRRSVSQLAS